MNAPATILIADDEMEIQEGITALLEEEGFRVLQAKNGIECVKVTAEHQPDLVLLDIRMPQQDGRETLRQLRARSNVPIIMLTALPGLPEKLGRLNDGADDYVAKPFDADELVARIRALLRRTKQPASVSRRTYNDGVLRIDFEAYQVSVKNERVGLSPKEWRLLEFLFKHANQAVPREKILQHVWGAEYKKEFHYLKVFISHLRKKLRDLARHSRYIHTERAVGYRFETHD